MRRAANAPTRFADGTHVRVTGTDEQVRALYGRELVGAAGTITRPFTRSHAHNRYLVHFPAHTYISPVKRVQSSIPDIEAVIREEHLQEVRE